MMTRRFLYGTAERYENVPLCGNTVIGTLALDVWTVTFGTTKRGLGEMRPRPVPSSLYQM